MDSSFQLARTVSLRPAVSKQMATRNFLIGAIVLFFGFQLRAVDTFVLNDKVSQVLSRRNAAQAAQVSDSNFQRAALTSPFDPPPPPAVPAPVGKKRITPPRWLGWSFMSVGAVLVLTCPLFRN